MQLLLELVNTNRALLEQMQRASVTIEQTNPEIYQKSHPLIGGASIGAHCRHILDFYQSFVAGVDPLMIDYDARRRDPRIEKDILAFTQYLAALDEQLQLIEYSAGQAVAVRSSVDTAKESRAGLSTLGRELQFLHSHTTHHMAIIGILMTLFEIKVDADFGKAPSTIRFERSQACARSVG